MEAGLGLTHLREVGGVGLAYERVSRARVCVCAHGSRLKPIWFDRTLFSLSLSHLRVRLRVRACAGGWVDGLRN